MPPANKLEIANFQDDSSRWLFSTFLPNLVKIGFTGFELWLSKEGAPKKLLPGEMSQKTQDCIELILHKLETPNSQKTSSWLSSTGPLSKA